MIIFHLSVNRIICFHHSIVEKIIAYMKFNPYSYMVYGNNYTHKLMVPIKKLQILLTLPLYSEYPIFVSIQCCCYNCYSKWRKNNSISHYALQVKKNVLMRYLNICTMIKKYGKTLFLLPKLSALWMSPTRSGS